jgi:hypothetical protein
MKEFLKSLFGRDRQGDSGPKVANSVGINDVLARRKPQAAPVLRAVQPRAGRAQLPPQETPRPIDFGEDALSFEAPEEQGFNPYDTGRFSAAELWEKRQRGSND